MSHDIRYAVTKPEPITASVTQYQVEVEYVTYRVVELVPKLRIVVTKQELLRLAGSFHRVVEGN